MNNGLPIVYNLKTASVTDISLHLTACNHSFIPPLSSRINLEEYAQKIHDKAVTFEAWQDKTLIGLIAAYFSSNEQKMAFITNVSVYSNYMGAGIASKLLGMTIHYASQHHYSAINLEVNCNNTAAINFYKKNHFFQTETKEESIFLTYQINQ